MTYTITRLDPTHAQAFFELRSESLRVCPSGYSMDPTIWDAATLDKVARMLEPPDETQGFVLGAFVGDELVGAVGLLLNGRWKAAHLATVWGFFVREPHQGRGIGRALIDALLVRADTIEELEQVRLMVPDDLGPALAVFRACGFESYGLERRGRRTALGYHDLEYMQTFLARSPEG